MIIILEEKTEVYLIICIRNGIENQIKANILVNRKNVGTRILQNVQSKSFIIN